MVERIKKSLPLALSVFIHTTVLATTLLMVDEEIKTSTQKKTLVTLSMYEASKQSIDKSEKKVIKKPEKKVEKKFVKKPKKEVVKKIIKKKKIVKKEKTLEPILPEEEKKIVSAEELESHTHTEVTPLKKRVSPSLLNDKTLLTSKQASQKNPEDIDPNILGMIRDLIQKSLVYPSMARRLKIEGVVLVKFILTQDGSVKSAIIAKKSGSNLLDSKALDTVLSLSGEYPKILKETQLKIPIAFSLKKS